MAPKILIVDDEPNIVVPLQFLMEQSGYSVRVADSGEAAIDEIVRFEPDLLLLDIMLPDMDGLEVCQAVKKNDSRTRIVFISALGRDMDITKGMAMGADAYITKPFSNTDVISRVRELLKDDR